MSRGEGEQFSFSSIENFDEHIAREIKGYDILDDIVRGVAESTIEDGSNVYDIGCSTGRLINSLAVTLDAEPDLSRRKRVSFIGIESNENMTSQFTPASDMVQIRKERVTDKTTFENASLIASIFTLQFLPVHQRPAILKNIHDGLNPNGVFVWAEKVHASDTRIEAMLNTKHMEFKLQGSSAEDILDKDQRLRSVMRPLDLATNQRMLEDAGFSRYEVFWRVNNFLGMMAIKSY